MSKIIINADDFGLSEGVNKGILHCYKNGIVNSSSLMTNGNSFEKAVDIIKKHELQNIGLHFNLTEGLPLLAGHKTLVDEFGFLKRTIHLESFISLNEVNMELEAQYKKAVGAGIKINHFDSHHHLHMTASFRKAFVLISKKYNIPLRKNKNNSRNPIKFFQFYKDTLGAKYYTNSFTAEFYDKEATKTKLISLLKQYKGKSIEIMCHPGYVDENNGSYNEQRERELNLLTDNEIKIKLCQFL